jgi:hypothetical protein
MIKMKEEENQRERKKKRKKIISKQRQVSIEDHLNKEDQH